MKKRYLPLAIFATAALTVAFPTLHKRSVTSQPWRLATSAAATLAPKHPTVIFDDNVRVIGKNWGKRIYLIHGLPGLPGYWESAERAPLLDALLADGDQIVLLRLPEPRSALFVDQGAAYCRAFAAWFSQLDAKIGQRYGPARQYSIGVSYGGYHAMLAAQDPHIDGWAAISPVTDLSRLAEYHWQSNDACRPDTARIGAKPGLMVYGQRDERVGSDLMQAMADNIEGRDNANFEAARFDTPGHTMSAAMIAKVGAWAAARSVAADGESF
jgi:alpha-beta hydrolase superfamily lysophospholipase